MMRLSDIQVSIHTLHCYAKYGFAQVLSDSQHHHVNKPWYLQLSNQADANMTCFASEQTSPGHSELQSATPNSPSTHPEPGSVTIIVV